MKCWRLRVFLGAVILLLNGHFVWSQQLSAPITNPPPAAEPTTVAGQHLVQPGDTYYRLAKIYQVPVDSLVKWNGANLLTGKTIRVGAHLPVANPDSGKKEEHAINATPKVTVNPAVVADKPASTTMSRSEDPDKYTPAHASQHTQRVLVIPFDPYLYFSDADHDIGLQSRIPPQNVRYIFRARLNAFLDPKGFTSINLLNTSFPDSTNQLRTIYQSLAYSYQDIAYSRFNPLPAKPKTLATGPKAWFQRQKEKLGLTQSEEKGVAEKGGKYYGVKVKNPSFYSYFNQQYHVDYYLFVNQFEIHTDYTNCIDRVTQNFERELVVHYTIYTAQGELVAGNKINIPYVSNINDVDTIVRDNLNKMAQRILADLPQPEYITSSKAAQE